MYVLHSLSHYFTGPTTVERVVVFLTNLRSDLKGMDLSSCFYKKFTREDNALLQRQIIQLREDGSCYLALVKTAVENLKRRGRNAGITIETSPHLHCSPSLDEETLIVATIHELIRTGENQKASLLFLAQSEASKNAVYEKMIRGENPNDFLQISKGLPREIAEFFLRDGLFKFAQTGHILGVGDTLVELGDHPETYKTLARNAITTLLRNNVTLSDVESALSNGNTPSYVLDITDSLHLHEQLENRAFREATSFAMRIRDSANKQKALIKVVKALTCLKQLKAHPELLQESRSDKIRTSATYGIAGRVIRGIKVPFTLQIQSAQELLFHIEEGEAKERCKAAIVKARKSLPTINPKQFLPACIRAESVR